MVVSLKGSQHFFWFFLCPALDDRGRTDGPTFFLRSSNGCDGCEWTLQLLSWSSAKCPAIFCISLVPAGTSLLDQWSWCEWCSFPWCWWQHFATMVKIFMTKSSNQWRSTMTEPVPRGVAASTMSLQESWQAIAKEVILKTAACLSTQKLSNTWRWTKSSARRKLLRLMRFPSVDLRGLLQCKEMSLGNLPFLEPCSCSV